MIKFSSTIIFFILFIHPSAVNGQSREFEILKNIELIDQIHEYLELYFVDELKPARFLRLRLMPCLKNSIHILYFIMNPIWRTTD